MNSESTFKDAGIGYSSSDKYNYGQNEAPTAKYFKFLAFYIVIEGK